MLGALSIYGPSAGTRLSFERAMERLGTRLITVAPAQAVSFTVKAESQEGMVTVIGQSANIMLLCHPKWGATRRAIDAVAVPVINGGYAVNRQTVQVFSGLYTTRGARV